MKLQFAFGNPHRGPKKKAKKPRRKSVAKRHKKAKTKGVKRKFSKFKKAVEMAKRKRKHVVRRKKSGKRKNPVTRMAYKVKDGKKKLVGSASFPLKHEYAKKIENDPTVKRFKRMLKKAKDAGEKSMLANKIIQLKKLKANKYIDDINAKNKYMQRLEEEGAEIKSFIHKEKAVAKRKKKKSRKARKTKKGGAKRASRRRKHAKKASSKSTKRARRKKHAKKAAKSAKRTSRRRRRSKRRYPKMVAHKHAKSTRHIKRGSTAKVKARKSKGGYKISTHFGKGRKKVRMTGRVRVSKKGLLGRFKINPFGRNPMKDLSAQSKKYLGLDAADLGSLAAGGALVPIANGLIGKYAPKIASMISQYVGPQAAGSVVPILVGIAMNAAAEHGVKSGQAHDLLKKAGEGLAAAGVIGLAMSFSQRYAAPAIGLSGINYTPSMRGLGIMPQLNGINYTPSMQGINYTPDMRGMGIMPQLNGMGRSPDFGSANYGGGGGSAEARTQRSDFGAWDSQDSEAEGLADQDNSYSASMN